MDALTCLRIITLPRCSYRTRDLNFIPSIWGLPLHSDGFLLQIPEKSTGRDTHGVSAFFFLSLQKSKPMKSEVLSDREIRILTEQIQLPDIGISGQEKIK